MIPSTRERQVRAAVETRPGLGHYMRTVTRDRLLSPEHESDLGKRVQAGRVAAQRLEELAGHASPRLRARLRSVTASGGRAQQALLRHNMRLAISMARKFHASTTTLDEEYLLDDRIQDATIGLMRAIELFDPAKGYRFTTYASWWIRQALQRGSVNEGSVQLPMHMWERLSKLWKARADLREAGGVVNVRSFSMVTGMSESEIQQAIEAEPRLLVSRLDAPVGEDGGATVGQLMPDPLARPEQEAIRSSAASELRRRLTERLSEREAFILERRYGLVDDREWTLEEVGEELGVTRERVRQVQKKVLERLSGDEVIRALL